LYGYPRPREAALNLAAAEGSSMKARIGGTLESIAGVWDENMNGN